jgi:Cd2+/Zn2+-exporting ATPase
VGFERGAIVKNGGVGGLDGEGGGVSASRFMQKTWTETLAEFLRNEPGVGAVRLDAGARRVQVATLGQVDLAALRERLAETLTVIEAELAAGGVEGAAPAGFTLTREGDVVQLSAPGCETSPKFWRWKEYEWPEGADEHEHEAEDWRELAAYAGACGVLGLAGWGVQRAGAGPEWLSVALFGGALIAGAWDAAKDSWENLRKAKLDIHFLMLAVAAGATAIGAWGEAVLLLFLFSASGAMEAYADERTHREVDALLKTAPKQATVVGGDGRERVVAVEEVGIGDLVRVRPGEAFCADGVVEKGESGADESALTGESVPVDKTRGDQVFSGTINVGGTLDWKVVRLPSESTLQKIIRLIHGAQKLRAPSQRFTDKFGTGYTYAVLGASAAMFLVWWLALGLEPWRGDDATPSAFYRAMTLLVVMSPCALVLSIPSAILAAIAWGARRGVLFRGGAAIEKLAEVNVIALDKTGTLTTGELVVDAYESFPPGREREVMELAYALEARSEHPLARAVVRDARARGLAEREIEGFESMTGQGVRGRLNGAQVMLGRRELLEKGPLKDWAAKLPTAAAEFAEVWVVGPDYLGRVLLKDAIRHESAPVLAKLKARGLRSVMLTGDRHATADAVGAELGLDEVRAGLSPAQKVEAVTALKEGGKWRVAMVGDGVNDAPSLAAADVAIAMGARGSDAALEQAEIVLMNDRIENVYSAYDLSRRARAVIRQNLAIALGVVGVMALATIAVEVPLGLGVAAHEGSTVLVCLNSLRLLFGRGR